ncbi:MAG: sulfotransferase [Candidatus Marinimicrobia bacterium]|jgi:hypothetical protein|nr:sulfotransferase [Candidatus Neomarinimicrobiota bacterium]|tara:strand:- start:235 stop:1107 length:873 start_codon:yes stop_codon:yes gene_type:complete
MPQLINAFIIGAQKCGTTSLLNYISEHDDILGHEQIEMSFFYKDEEYREGYEEAWRRYYHSSNGNNIVVIAKNAHMYRDEKAIERLYNHNPKCKIIFIVRNPVDRAYSSYLMEKNAWGEVSSFDELIIQTLKTKDDWRYRVYIELGIYHYHLQRIFKYFKNNVIVIRLDDLRTMPEQTVKNIYFELDVDDSFTPDLTKSYNVTTKVRSEWYAKKSAKILREDFYLKKVLKSILNDSFTYRLGQYLRKINRKNGAHQPMDSHTREKLVEFYKPHNARLSRMFNMDFSCWDN